MYPSISSGSSMSTNPLVKKYTISFVDIKRLSNITLHVPGGPLGRVFKKYIITVTILFFPKGLGTLPIP